jgi:hypothetical protein
MEITMKSYQAILKEVKAKNPEISHKDAQKAASKIFREAQLAKQKEAEENKSTAPPAAAKKKAMSKAKVALSEEIESVILGPGNSYDKNKILRVANTYGDFELVEAGKDGVNTLVYLRGPVRVPATGYFKIFKT